MFDRVLSLLSSAKSLSSIAHSLERLADLYEIDLRARDLLPPTLAKDELEISYSSDPPSEEVKHWVNKMLKEEDKELGWEEEE